MKNEVINIDGVLFLKSEVEGAKWKPYSFGEMANVVSLDNGGYALFKVMNIPTGLYYYEIA